MTEMPGSFWLPRMSRLTRRLPATRVMQRSIQQLKRRCEPFASLQRTFPSYRVSSVTWVPYQAWHVACLNEQFPTPSPPFYLAIEGRPSDRAWPLACGSAPPSLVLVHAFFSAHRIEHLGWIGALPSMTTRSSSLAHKTTRDPSTSAIASMGERKSRRAQRSKVKSCGCVKPGPKPRRMMRIAFKSDKVRSDRRGRHDKEI